MTPQDFIAKWGAPDEVPGNTCIPDALALLAPDCTDKL
jgi:hypothetical protein